MPNNLHEFDLVRIERDLAQYRELIDRKQYLWENETDEEKKEILAQELAQLSDLLTQTQAYLQP